MEHPLSGAYARAHRAEEHLADLRHLVEAFWKTQVNHILTDFNPTVKQVGITVGKLDPPPVAAAIRCGEIIYNLRTALDYLVFELALLDTGSIQKGTQFPIESSKEEGVRRQLRFCKGLNAEHRAVIEALQPYNGCEWTASLASLSNPDKHRHLTLMVHNSEALTRLTAGSPGTFDGLPGTVYRTSTADGHPQDMHVHVELIADVTFTDGTLVVETLEQVHREVVNTLETFKMEFET